MKALIIPIFLLLLIMGNTAKAQFKTKYIEFEAIGNQVKYKPPVFISKQKLDTLLDETLLITLKQKGHIERQFPRAPYDSLVTDENTYNLLLAFILKHDEFYSNDTDKINPAGSLDIVAEGTIYNLFYKTKKGFFKAAADLLEANNGDKKVIIELGKIN